MENYFRVVVKVDFEDRKGRTKKRSENYIVSAITPTEVEVKMTEYLKGSDFEIVTIAVTKILDIIK